MFFKENYRTIIEQWMPFHRLLDTRLQDVREGYAAILIPFKEVLVGDPRTKRIHGGVLAFALDAVGSAAGMTTLSHESDLISTLDIRIDYLHPGRPEDLLAEGFLVKSGSGVLFAKMVVQHPTAEAPIAEGRAVYRVKRHNS